MDKFVKREIKYELNLSNEWLSAKLKPKMKLKTLIQSSIPTKLNRKRKHENIFLQKNDLVSPVISNDCKKVLKNLHASSFKKEYEKQSLKFFDKEKGFTFFFTRVIIRITFLLIKFY